MDEQLTPSAFVILFNVLVAPSVSVHMINDECISFQLVIFIPR